MASILGQLRPGKEATWRPKKAGIRGGLGFSEHQGLTWAIKGYVGISWAPEASWKANPHWYLVPGRLGYQRVKGSVSTFSRIPAGRLYVDMYICIYI